MIDDQLQTMKKSSTKTVVVRLTSDNVSEYKVDCEIFDDPYLEASTRAIEHTKTKAHGIVRAISECWDKREPSKVRTYNSYFLLVNAACYSKAELLREKFRMQTDVDLAKEPIHGTPPDSK